MNIKVTAFTVSEKSINNLHAFFQLLIFFLKIIPNQKILLGLSSEGKQIGSRSGSTY